MLTIVLIPSVALMIIGVGGAGFLVQQGYSAQNWATAMQETVAPGTEFASLAEDERKLSLRVLGGDKSVLPQLKEARAEFDESVSGMTTLKENLKQLNPEAIQDADAVFNQLLAKLKEVRQGVDAGLAPTKDVDQYYSGLVELIKMGLQGIAETAPDPKTAVEESTATTLFGVADSMSRAHALAVGGFVSGQITPETYQQVSRHTGRYHTDMEQVIPILTPPLQKRVTELMKSPEWQRLTEVENALLRAGPGGAPQLPVSVEEWQNASAKVNTELMDIYSQHHHYAEGFAAKTGEETFRNSLIGGGVVVLIALFAALVAARLSNRVVRRMKRLRNETLDLADEHLPSIVSRLRNGERVDVNQEMRPLDFGGDELGEVAQAFSRAESAAVRAAVEEAEMRAGINALFLNIAHRSQVVVHRQLEALDSAEHKEEDPDRLAVLFHLDNLATRARRNAENLMLLGGEEPGRKWRNPVPLSTVIRGAISETEEYARVHTGAVSKVSIIGSVVADLIHLLAELVENATSFSPPESRVEVTGTVVGRGVCVEITDQGVGMAYEQLEQTNAMLQQPPHFGVEDLSQDSRMGLRVVAQIAQRHDMSVRLRESDYGGIRAIVLISTGLTVREDEPAALMAGPSAAGARNGATPAGASAAGGLGTASNTVPPLPQPTTSHNGVHPSWTGSAEGTTAPTHGGHVRGGGFSGSERSAGVPQESTSHVPSQPQWTSQRVPGEPTARSQSGTIPPSAGMTAPSPAGQPTAAAGDVEPTAGRPSLPRRNKQANLAPPLANSSPQAAGGFASGQVGFQQNEPQQGQQQNGQHNAPRHRSSEQVRDLFSEIESGTRRGRTAPPATDGNDNDRREG